MIKAVHHVAISTPDIGQLKAFYCGGFGFKEVSRAKWPTGTEAINRVMAVGDTAALTVMLELEGFCLELFQFSQPEQRLVPDRRRPVHHYGITHLCFRVADIDKEYQRLLELGADFHCRPQDFGAEKATYGRDPDGNVFELQEVATTWCREAGDSE